jgi:D-beta-D-heptose 7-phosphate kinase/D-beta-D-heptose 1-phosphate adenosyltransferase
MLIENTKNVLVVGDIMIDEYISGQTNRLSPEAPVPVLLVNKEFCVLGGAANVANNFAALDIKCGLFGFKGKDQNATLLSRMLKKVDIEDLTFESSVPTITKTRIVAQQQQIVRIDREVKFDNPSLAQESCKEILPNFKGGIIVISDYGKGLCSQAFLSYLIQQSKMLGIKTFIDPKGNNWEKYRGANLVKPNVKELGDVLGFEIENKDDIIVEYGRMILTQYDIDYLLITRSEKGMTLLHENEALHIHSEAKEVYDVSGAGDTVIATLVLGLIEGKDIQDAIHLANVAAGVVVGKFGTATVSRKELGIQLRIQ